jgi:hypothetical protein
MKNLIPQHKKQMMIYLWTLVPDTTIDIEIKNNNSRILCTFSANALIGASSTLGVSAIEWQIYLDIFGAIIGNYGYVKYMDHAGVSASREIATAFSMQLVTVPLEPGNYSVVVYWRSLGIERDLTTCFSTLHQWITIVP